MLLVYLFYFSTPMIKLNGVSKETGMVLYVMLLLSHMPKKVFDFWWLEFCIFEINCKIKYVFLNFAFK